MIQSKLFQSLNLIDSAFFQIFTEDISNAKLISRIIIKRVTGHMIKDINVESEKSINGFYINSRGIRMDLCTEEMAGEKVVSVYDLEPNKYTDYNLPLRSRYYQVLSDGKALRKNEDLEELPQFVSIWILTYDPFGDNRMLYTIKNKVEENYKLVYNDRVVRYMLYDRGEIGGSKELKALLKFITDTCEENAVDDELKELYEAVVQIRKSEEACRKYMTLEQYVRLTCKPMIEEAGKKAYDEAYKDAYKNAYEDAYEDAYENAYSESRIETTILTCKRIELDDEQTVRMLMQNCSLTEDKARLKLSEYKE